MVCLFVFFAVDCGVANSFESSGNRLGSSLSGLANFTSGVAR